MVMAMEGAIPAAGFTEHDTVMVRADVNAAVIQAYNEHYVAVARLAYLLVGDPHQAEDLAHEAFARLHTKWERLKDKDRTLPYLRTTVVNQARSVGRRERTAAKHPPPAERPNRSAEEAAVAGLDRDAVLAALAALPPRQRAAIVLRHYLRRTEGEIAETMGCSVGTVRTHLKRANAALTTSLGGHE
jgi:RNA polymerase sigma-70 factor (sigma-E family)